jgi:hypothetical protein
MCQKVRPMAIGDDAGDVSTLIDLSSRDRTLSERIVCFLSYPRIQVPIPSKAKPFLDSAFSTIPSSPLFRRETATASNHSDRSVIYHLN